MKWKEHRLKKNKQFSYLYQKGKRVYGKSMNLFYVKSKFENFKVGFVVNKKIGNSVVRSKVKRRMKESFALCEKASFNNYVFVAKEKIEEKPYLEIMEEMQKLLKEVK